MSTTRILIRLATGLTATAAMVIAATPAQAATRGAADCEFDEATATLTVVAGNPKSVAATIVREGDDIRVLDAYSNRRAVIDCDGPQATVHNTDQVVLDASGAVRDQYFGIDHSGGPFVPGLTDEGDGSSEIEFDVTILQKGRHPDAHLAIDGSAGDDHFELGALGDDTGFNLNGAEPTPDVDVVLHQRLDTRPSSQVTLPSDLGDGDDTLDASGTALFDGPIDLGYGILEVKGRGGADVLRGGLLDDRLAGGPGDDVLEPGAGDDSAKGGGDADTITDPEGQNWLNGGPGADTLTGGSGKDDIDGGDGGDTIDAGGGKNYIDAGKGDDTVLAGADRDRIWAGKGKDAVDGGDGDDRINGENGADTIDGGGGDDRIDGSGGADVLLGRGGADTLNGEQGPDDIRGGGGDDRLQGDYRWGRGADDVLVGGGGADSFNGRGGADVIDAVDGFIDSIRCDGADLIDADPDDELVGACA